MNAECPFCKGSVNVEKEWLGRDLTCGICRRAFVVHRNNAKDVWPLVLKGIVAPVAVWTSFMVFMQIAEPALKQGGAVLEIAVLIGAFGAMSMVLSVIVTIWIIRGSLKLQTSPLKNNEVELRGEAAAGEVRPDTLVSVVGEGDEIVPPIYKAPTGFSSYGDKLGAEDKMSSAENFVKCTYTVVHRIWESNCEGWDFLIEDDWKDDPIVKDGYWIAVLALTSQFPNAPSMASIAKYLSARDVESSKSFVEYRGYCDKWPNLDWNAIPREFKLPPLTDVRELLAIRFFDLAKYSPTIHKEEDETYNLFHVTIIGECMSRTAKSAYDQWRNMEP